MAKQTKGRCWCCSGEFTRTGMLKHLDSCEERTNIQHKAEKGKDTGYFELLIMAKYTKSYWLVIEIADTAKLKDLDEFIRDIWVECCGHLSSFKINGRGYDSLPSGESIWGSPAESMNIQLKKILDVGMQIKYEYDFGTTTELVLEVKKHRIGKQKKEKITILSRNNPLEILCSICQTNPAVWVNPEGYYEDTPFWCEECLHEKNSESEDGYDEALDYLLPVCNSPRMGVCGYEGSEGYGE